MKVIKNYLTLSGAALLTLYMANVSADFNSDADAIMNWGETSFPQFLSSHEASQTFDVWRFRYYKQSNLLVGVNSQDTGIYTMVNSPGATPSFFAKLADALKNINTAADSPVCDQAQAPAGVNFTTVGDTTKISTNGQCVKVPKGPICAPPASATGVSVLSSENIQTFAFKGLEFKDSALGDQIKPFIMSAVNVKSCIKNAPPQFAKQKLELDVCLDVTDQMADYATFADYFTIAPPVTISMQGKVENALASPDDCFKSDAKIIYDALSKETWLNVNGQFVKQ